jgi:transposase-like protein
MIEEKRCPKCGRKEKVKNGFMRGKQRYKCKN